MQSAVSNSIEGKFLMTAIQSSPQEIPGAKKRFVNRHEEIKQFHQALAEGHYLEVKGIAGQGKTELLNWICDYNDKKDYLAIYLTLSESKYRRPEVFPILRTIADALSRQGNIEPPFSSFYQALDLYEQALRQHRRHPMDDVSANRQALDNAEKSMIKAFNEDLSRILKTGKRIVLCVDNTEMIRGQEAEEAGAGVSLAWNTFETEILKPHLQQKNFMLVTAGQKRVTWNTFAIRKRIKPLELSFFTADDVLKQVTSLTDVEEMKIAESFAPALHRLNRLTRGHPFSNYKIVDLWTGDDGKFQKPLKPETIEKKFDAGIRKLMDEIVLDRFLKDIKLDREYPAAIEVLKTLSPLRYFQLDKLHYMLSAFLGNDFAGKPISFFERVLSIFLKSGNLLTWKSGIGYEMNPVMRSILLEHTRVNSRDLFISMHDELAKRHGFWLEQAQGVEKIKCFVEKLYHQMKYLAEKDSGKVVEVANKELQHFIEHHIKSKTAGSVDTHSQFDTLKNEISNDAELSEMVNTSKLVELIERERH
jgi:hypothetical protein